VKALVLDTHAWVWWISKPEKLSRMQRSAIDRARKQGSVSLLLSVISGWEVALLVQAGRLRLPVPLEAWLQQAMSVPGLEVVPLTVSIMATAVQLTALRDPADMLIVATAQQYGARLVTSDARIEESGTVQVVG
jgi:PIN domain nuclease of toxin-antitoxin system